MADQKITQLTEDSAPALTDLLANVEDPGGTPVTKKVTIANVLALAYPVGSIYISVNSTNPATSLGFGTWSAFGAGRVPVGFSSGETEFDADEETGGAKTVTLTAAQSGVPAHTHIITDRIRTPSNGSGINHHATDAGGAAVASTRANTAADASEAHNNLQPYIVVRMWKRTA